MNKVRPLPSGQSAYKPFHSTETSILKVQSDIWMTRKSLSFSCLTSAWHSTQLTTISYWETLGFGFGVGRTTLNVSRHIFSKKTEQVQIKGTLTEKQKLTTGVPHGSCLVPVLSPTRKWICKSQKPAQCLLSARQHQENPKISEPGSHMHDYTCIYYCKSLMNGLPENHINKLQCVHNTVVSLVFNLRKYVRITSLASR